MEDTYYLQEEYLEPDSDDGFSYHEVSVDDAIESSGDEDLATAQQNERATTKPETLKPEPLISSSSSSSLIHPEVVDDFVRNFLVRMGMTRTAECFQSEWYELELSGKLKSHQTLQLPDVYSQNRQLELMLHDLQEQLASHKEAARLSKEKFVCLKKERDYHRMHHRRIVQEKTKLTTDVKRMKQHFSNYEPMLQGLKHKYESVTKEKTLACIERDRAMSEVGCLQSTLQSVQQTQPPASAKAAPLKDGKQKPTQKHKVCEFPPEPSNPHRQAKLPVSSHLTRTGGLQQSSTVAAHQYAASSVCLHPSKPVAATTSDDHTWKMWALPSGELLMTGEGHGDWVGVADFHPRGSQLATASGDGTLKVWDFARGECVLTFPDHQQPVWGCSWHWSGQFLVSGGMDHCCKLWDVNNAKCVVTLRGHADSVNAVIFLPYSNTLATCSADKTLSLWDARTGLCVQTFYGHHHSCNDVVANLQGHQLYSCDCLGAVLQWDVRMQAAQCSWDLGPFPVSKLALDPAGAVLACASGDNLIRLLDTAAASQKEWVLEGHGDSVLGVCFSKQADYLLSCASDGSLIQWQ